LIVLNIEFLANIKCYYMILEITILSQERKRGIRCGTERNFDL